MRVGEYIPEPELGREIYYVKGLRVPQASLEGSLARVVAEYYSVGENMVVLSSSFSGKREAIAELVGILKGCVVFAHGSSGIDGAQDISFLEEAKQHAQHLIFYNIPIPFERLSEGRHHVSAFYDYATCHKRLEDAVEAVTASFPEHFRYTLVCRRPNPKNVSFLFGTNASIKHLCVEQLEKLDPTVLYARSGLATNAGRVVDRVDGHLRARRFVFYDIDCTLVRDVVSSVDNVVFIYTKDDFPSLEGIARTLEDLGIAVPEHIKMLGRRNNKNNL